MAITGAFNPTAALQKYNPQAGFRTISMAGRSPKR
jgi:hypothetical protein